MEVIEKVVLKWVLPGQILSWVGLVFIDIRVLWPRAAPVGLYFDYSELKILTQKVKKITKNNNKKIQVFLLFFQ